MLKYGMTYKMYAGICLIKNDKVLLTLQSEESDQPGKWGLPAGHVEIDETPQEAAVREAREEIGVDTVLTGLVQAVILRRPKREDALVIIYKGKIKDGQSPKVDGKEVTDYSWVDKKDIENDKVDWRHPFFKKFVLQSFGEEINATETIEIVNYEV